MTSLVFVHGVNTRSTAAHLAAVKVRDQLFLEVGLGGNGTIINSGWGDLVTTWSWDEASLPTPDDVRKDAPYALGTVAAPKAGAPTSAVAAFARSSPREAVDEVFVQLIDQALLEQRTVTDDELRDFKGAVTYLGKEEVAQPKLFTARSDELFARELRSRISEGGAATYGLLDPLTKCIKGFADRIGNAASGVAVDLARGGLNDRIGRFLGDIFTYLQDQGPTRQMIRQEIIGKLQEGTARGDKLVAVGHSMGGVILYDLLSDPAKPLGNIRVDLLVTVGSQVGVFEEMKLYRSSSPAFSAASKNRVPALPNVSRWLNVYDPVDMLGFRCSPIFEGVEDFVFSSTTSLLDANTAYFKRPRFFARFAARLKP
jgi:hypothetical protein